MQAKIFEWGGTALEIVLHFCCLFFFFHFVDLNNTAWYLVFFTEADSISFSKPVFYQSLSNFSFIVLRKVISGAEEKKKCDDNDESLVNSAVVLLPMVINLWIDLRYVHNYMYVGILRAM